MLAVEKDNANPKNDIVYCNVKGPKIHMEPNIHFRMSLRRLSIFHVLEFSIQLLSQSPMKLTQHLEAMTITNSICSAQIVHHIFS